ncbi:MAG: glycosyltransferase [Tateyamaria sp.]|jgi:predicted glycosyltransferase|uniref:glycosyltransferase family protein n=1 Tax=Tateyamaria sp. TaxID=1929288 RepID=UPI0032DD8AD3
MKVMIVVTHLLGTGHLARALTLGRAFQAKGDHVTVLSGGRPVPHFNAQGMRLIQLPPVHSNGTDFTTLLGKDGAPADPAYMDARRDMLLDALAEGAPDIMITELFPFGRRILRDEFGVLLEAARDMEAPPLVLSSIRDILAPPSKPVKAVFADEQVTAFYDGVLVHSDPDLVTLGHSWPVSDTLAPSLHYTGFVAPAPPNANTNDHGSILVSAGGGDVGERIFEAALDAASLMPQVHWLFLIGGTDARRDRFIRTAPPHVDIQAPRPDFRTLLAGAAASVSMCGYNTAMDVLQTGVPAVLVPFDDGGEVEQGLRSEALSHLDGITVLLQAGLNGPALATALEDVRNAPVRPPRQTNMNGAARSVEIAHDLRGRQVSQ